MMRYLCAVLLVLLFSAPAWAATFFVATTGNDTNPGSAALPWRNIQKCANTAASGDTCSVNDGTYTAATNSPTNPCAIDLGAGTECVVFIKRSGITFKSTNPRGAKISGRSNTEMYGFAIQGTDGTTIQDFEIFGVAHAGIFDQNTSNSTNYTIRGNWIHDIGRLCTNYQSGIDGILVGIGSSGVLIEGNTFNTIGRQFDWESGCSGTTEWNADHGIYADDSIDLTIRRNLFYDIRNGFPIHVYPGQQTRLKIQNNTFSDTNGNQGARAPSFSGGLGHILISAPIATADIANNLFYQPSYAGIFCTGSSCVPATYSNVSIHDNMSTALVTGCCSGGSWPSGVTITNSSPNVTASALFTNPATRDYSLKPGSPAIDIGVALTGITCTGICDMGYLESGVVPPPPPSFAPGMNLRRTP